MNQPARSRTCTDLYAWNARPDPSRSPTDRLCPQGILFVLYTGIAWQQLPVELGLCFGQTCRRQLRRRREAGVFDALHRVLLTELNAARLNDRTCACGNAATCT
ncbi:transposase [Streptomyces virginiae]